MRATSCAFALAYSRFEPGGTSRSIENIELSWIGTSAAGMMPIAGNASAPMKVASASPIIEKRWSSAQAITDL